jgi:hypothetical protein
MIALVLHVCKLSRKPIIIASEEPLLASTLRTIFFASLSSVRNASISVPAALVKQAFGTRLETEEDEDTFSCYNFVKLPLQIDVLISP